MLSDPKLFFALNQPRDFPQLRELLNFFEKFIYIFNECRNINISGRKKNVARISRKNLTRLAGENDPHIDVSEIVESDERKIEMRMSLNTWHQSSCSFTM
jgi:hypothetical protein